MIKLENVEVVGWDAGIRGMRNPMNSWDKSDSGQCFKDISCHTCKADRNHCKTRMKNSEFVLGHNDHDLMMRLRNAGKDHRKFMRMIVVYIDITAPLYWWKEFDTYKVGTVANSCSTMHKIADKEFTLDDFSTEHLFRLDDMCPHDERRDPAEDKALAAIDVDGNVCFFTTNGYMEMTYRILNYYRNKYLEIKNDHTMEETEREKLMKKYWWQMIQLLPSSYNQKRTVMLNYEVLANMYRSRKNHKLDEWVEFCNWIETLPYSEIITGIAKAEAMFEETLKRDICGVQITEENKKEEIL